VPEYGDDPVRVAKSRGGVSQSLKKPVDRRIAAHPKSDGEQQGKGQPRRPCKGSCRPADSGKASRQDHLDAPASQAPQEPAPLMGLSLGLPVLCVRFRVSVSGFERRDVWSASLIRVKHGNQVGASCLRSRNRARQQCDCRHQRPCNCEGERIVGCDADEQAGKELAQGKSGE